MFSARVKARDVGSEVAVLELIDKAPSETFTPIPLRNTAVDLKPGEKIAVFGHPNGVEDVVMSSGKFTDRQKFNQTSVSQYGVNPYSMFLRSDARVRGGNSGGPVLDSNGQVIGLVNFRQTDNGGQYIGVDSIRSLIKDPEQGQLHDQRSFFIPSTLQWDRESISSGLYAGLGAVTTFNNHLERRMLTSRVSPLTRLGGNAFTASIGAIYAPDDYDAFKSAWENGTTAEKVSAGINLAGDFVMSAGALAGMTKRFAIVGTAVSTVGALAKFSNSLMADRRFK